MMRNSMKYYGPEPPASLKQTGRNLWANILRDHDIRESGSLAVLAEACAAADRAADCAGAIAKDGLVVSTKNGPRDNPLIRHELSARALCARLLQRLGVAGEVSRPIGRPPMGLGVTRVQRYDDEADDVIS